MRAFVFLISTTLLFPLHGEIVDRLAIAVGHQVITQLQLDEELRVTALLNHRVVERDLEARRAAADHLVEQLLIKREMELSRYPLPEEKEVTTYLRQIQEENGNPQDFDRILQQYNLKQSTFREHLELQLTVLRFIAYRFRPDAAVTEEEIAQAYQRQIANWRATHVGNPPSLEVSREPLRVTLLEERTDSALNTWLEESRKQINIIYFDKALE